MRIAKFISVLMLFTSICFGQVAFEGAYGAGSSATGGRGGTVLFVNNLNNSGTGSFRAAFQTSGPRIIVFNVSGTIQLSSQLTTGYGNVTVLGQTAPQGGITFTGDLGNNPMFEISGRDNMIFRYIRVRPASTGGSSEGGTNSDAVQFVNSTNIMLDHISVSWGGDENVSFTGTSGNFTYQNSIQGEGHTGSIFGDSNSPALSGVWSSLGNLFYHVDHRHPNPNSNTYCEVLNNVIWNYGNRSFQPTGGMKINEINNYFRGMNYGDNAPLLENIHKYIYAGVVPSIYTKGNLHLPTTVTNPNATNNNNTWTSMGFTYNSTSYPDDSALPSNFFTSTKHADLGNAWPLMSALESLEYVKTNVGAKYYMNDSGVPVEDWDAVDDYYLGRVIADDVGTFVQYSDPNGLAWYDAFQLTISSTAVATRTGSYDTDNDGMSDAWEIREFGNLSKTANGTDLHAYLTNIEMFAGQVDGIIPPPIPETSTGAGARAFMNYLLNN